MFGFKNANIYVENQGIVNTSLSVYAGKIHAIGKNLFCEKEIKIPNRAIILPGFIDQHIHGAAGFDVMDASNTALLGIANSIAAEGVTGFLATTMTQSREKILSAMRSVKEYSLKNETRGAALLGIHLEGPFINFKKAGAQPVEYIQKPNVDQFNEYNEESGNLIKIVTLAPELEKSKEFIEYLIKKKIIVSIGHTLGNYEDLLNAVNNGASQITHTYNAQTPFNHREIGICGGALLNDDVACEIICDLIHVSIPALKLLFKNKPKNKVILITDAMRAKNLGNVESELGGQKVFVSGAEARLEDGTLAGSVLKMNIALKNIVEKCGLTFIDAVDFVSANPAKNLGLYDEMGSIKIGKKANLTVIDRKNYEILLTIRDGNIIYNKL